MEELREKLVELKILLEIPNYISFQGKAPYPTLIGGNNPNIKAAGTIEFRGGKIYKIDNFSGHFKPDPSTMNYVEILFKNRFVQNSFDNNFQGFIKIGQ